MHVEGLEVRLKICMYPFSICTLLKFMVALYQKKKMFMVAWFNDIIKAISKLNILNVNLILTKLINTLT
jgi:hypothetical protein